MRTELKTEVSDTGLSLTRFWSGNERGVCVQLTVPHTCYVTLTRDEAALLAWDLMDFADGQEQELEE